MNDVEKHEIKFTSKATQMNRLGSAPPMCEVLIIIIIFKRHQIKRFHTTSFSFNLKND